MAISRSPDARRAAMVALVGMVACSSFGTGGDGSGGSPVPDAGPNDAGASADAPAESSTTGPLTVTAFGCNDPQESQSGTGLFDFESDEVPNGWKRDPPGGGGDDDDDLGVTDESFADGAKGKYLHARVVNKDLVTKPPTIVASDLAVPSKLRLEFDLAVEALEHFGTLGCGLDFLGSSEDDQVNVVIGAEREKGEQLVVGWNYRETLQQPESRATTPLEGWAKDKWQHVVMDAVIEGGRVAATVWIGNGPGAKVDDVPVAGFPFKSLRLRCGILFLEPVPPGTQQTMEIGIDNIEARFCAL